MEKQTRTQRGRVNKKNIPTIKRLLANKCERERVRKINEAFEILKTHIPYCDSGRIRTKLDVLKFAIDYIQILTKMVSQGEAAMLLRTSQIESTSDLLSSAGTSETESPRSPSEMFPARPEGASAFPFDDQQSPLGITSLTLSDDEVFFGVDGDNEEAMSGQYNRWCDHQSGFNQPQPHYHDEHHHNKQHHNEHHHNELLPQPTSLQTHRIPSFEEQEQDLLSFWPYMQGTDMLPKAIIPLERTTTPPSDVNDGELTAWFNL